MWSPAARYDGGIRSNHRKVRCECRCYVRGERAGRESPLCSSQSTRPAFKEGSATDFAELLCYFVESRLEELHPGEVRVMMLCPNLMAGTASAD